MARVSRKKQNIPSTPVDTSVRIWKTALYVRLSVEDNGKESDSVENQTALLEEYVANHPHLKKAALFVDNGYTGTDFLRPEFTRMMEAVQDGLVDCVVVKDLSRLGRNYIETSQFIEKICPFYGLRFIAVNDSYDTATVTSEGQLSASLSNIVNDYYAKDISRKVTSALRAKMERGDYIGNYAPHGYRKDPENKNHQMIIDPETAPVVRRIYMDVIAGKSCTQIAKELNNEGVPTPAQHKAVTRQASAKKPQWTHRALLGMIENIKYTGTMVNHTRESRFIRDKNQRRVPKEEWYIRENAHEAIVTQEEYDQAQDAIQRRKKSSRTTHDQSDRVYYCGHCGGKLEKANGTVFACPSHRYHDGSQCEQVRWRKAALEEVILEALKGQIEITRIEASDAKKAAKSKGDSLQRQLTLLKAQYDACGREKFTKYEEYREGKLTAEEYLASKDVLTAKQAALKEQLDECEAQYEANHQKSLAATAQQQTVTRMSGLSDDKLREHLYDAVERILVYDAESIEIVWKFNEIKKDTDNNVGVGA